MPVAFRKSQKWLDVLHLFVKWQVIYHTAWTLNALLMEPMCVFSPAFLYDGQIAMYLAIASTESVDHLVKDIDIKLYSQLKSIVLSPKLVSIPPAIPAKHAHSPKTVGNLPCDNTTKTTIAWNVHCGRVEPEVDENTTEQEGMQKSKSRADNKVEESSLPHVVHQPCGYVSRVPVQEEPKQEETEKQMICGKSQEKSESLMGQSGHMEPVEGQDNFPRNHLLQYLLQ